jgi:hypothetical protein
METNGAVFLPAAGNRYGADVGGMGFFGTYWASSTYDYDDYSLYFDSDDAHTCNNSSREIGRSVRLVRDVE